jgi:hypothetical protein
LRLEDSVRQARTSGHQKPLAVVSLGQPKPQRQSEPPKPPSEIFVEVVCEALPMKKLRCSLRVVFHHDLGEINYISPIHLLQRVGDYLHNFGPTDNIM